MSRKRQTSPDDAQKIAAHARQHVPCQDCAAGPGEPCTGPGAGRSVHKSRYIASAIAIKQRDKAARSRRGGAMSRPVGPVVAALGRACSTAP